MPREWVIVVNLGSFAMIGIGIIFLVVWAFDRQRWYALSFAGSIFVLALASLVISLPISPAAGAVIHGVLFPIAVVLLADGLVRRTGERLSVRTSAMFVVVLAAVVAFFSYVSPLLVGRVVTQNIGILVLLVVAVRLMWRSGARLINDRVALAAACVLALAAVADLVCAAVSTVPRELVTAADLDVYLSTPLEVAIIVATAVVLPAFMMTMLGVTIADVIVDLKFQRDRDELTGVLNRRGFNQCASQLQRTGPCALVLVDLDRFKSVNDALGHAVGDTVLVAVARELNRPSSDRRIVGRVGGEEFAVLLPRTDLDSAIEWAEAVRRRVERQTIQVGEQRITVTVSLGITYGESSAHLADLLEAADKALYRAKAGGRNRTAVECDRSSKPVSGVAAHNEWRDQ